MAARSKQQTGTLEAEQAEHARELEGDAEATAEDKLAQFFGRTGNDTRYSVAEVDPDDPRRPAFLFGFTGDEAPEPCDLLTQLLDAYGPGEYEIAARDPGTGQYTLRQRFLVGSRKERKRRQLVPGRGAREEAKPAAAQPPPAQSDGGGLADVRALLEHQSRMFETLLERLAQPPAREGPTLVEQLEQLGQLKKLFAPEQPTQSALATIKEVLELKDLLSEAGGGDASPMSAAVKELAPAIRAALEKHAATNPAAEGGAAQSDSPMKQWLGEIRQLAEQQVPAEQAALHVLQVLEQQPAWIEQTVVSMVLDDAAAAADRVIGFDADLAQYKSWLIEVAQKMAALILEAESEAATETESGATSDGKPSAPNGQDALRSP